MKKTLWKLMVCMTAAAISFSVSSCSDDDGGNISTDSIVGVWEGITQDEWYIEDGERVNEDYGTDIGDERYEFNADMTWRAYDTYNPNGGDRGKWELDGNTLKLIYYYPEINGYDYEAPDVFTVTIDGSRMTLLMNWKDEWEDYWYQSTWRKILGGDSDGTGTSQEQGKGKVTAP